MRSRLRWHIAVAKYVATLPRLSDGMPVRRATVPQSSESGWRAQWGTVHVMARTFADPRNTDVKCPPHGRRAPARRRGLRHSEPRGQACRRSDGQRNGAQTNNGHRRSEERARHARTQTHARADDLTRWWRSRIAHLNDRAVALRHAQAMRARRQPATRQPSPAFGVERRRMSQLRRGRCRSYRRK